MATPPSSNPIQVTATPVTVIRIKDNVARVKIGAKYWDVRILEKNQGSTSDTVLSMSDELAGAIEGIFQNLASQRVIDPQAHKKIILEGERKLGAGDTVESVTISKVKVQKDTADLEDVTNISEAAKRALNTLGETLKSHDVALHTQTTEERADNPPPPTTSSSDRPEDAATSTAPSPRGAQTAPTYSYTSKPLQEQFKDRQAVEVADPFVEPSRIIGRSNLRNDMATFIADIGSKGHLFGLIGKSDGNGFDLSSEFTKIKETLKKIHQNDPTKLASKASELEISLASGEISRLLGSDKEEDKKNLVKIYAACLKDTSLTKHFIDENFYHLLTCYLSHPNNRDKAYLQFKILSKDATGLIKIKSEIPTVAADATHTIYMLKERDTLKLYERSENTHLNLKNLDNITTLSESNQIEETTVDCGSGGRCADLSLADQILRIKGQNPASQREPLANNIREKIIEKLKDPNFYNNDWNKDAIKSALTDHEQEKIKLYKDQIVVIAESIEENASNLNASVSEAIKKLPERVQNQLHELIHNLCKLQLNSDADSSNLSFGRDCLTFASSAESTTLKFYESVLIDKKFAVSIIKNALSTLSGSLKSEYAELDAATHAERIANAYANIITDHNSWFDEVCFKALSECELDLTAFGGNNNEKFSIAIFENNSIASSGPKLFTQRAIYPYANADKARTLCLWRNGKDHYRSINREGVVWNNLSITT